MSQVHLSAIAAVVLQWLRLALTPYNFKCLCRLVGKVSWLGHFLDGGT